LTYGIDTAPAGSTVPPGGAFRWVIPVTQPPGEYPVILTVTDDGTPPRSNTVSFTITVRGPSVSLAGEPGPTIFSTASVNGQTTFTFGTIPGRTYRVLYKDDLAVTAWTQLDREFVAANSSASITDHITVPQRFYCVLQVE
jgi:hypothetical protein